MEKFGKTEGFTTRQKTKLNVLDNPNPTVGLSNFKGAHTAWAWRMNQNKRPLWYILGWTLQTAMFLQVCPNGQNWVIHSNDLLCLKAMLLSCSLLTKAWEPGIWESYKQRLLVNDRENAQDTLWEQLISLGRVVCHPLQIMHREGCLEGDDVIHFLVAFLLTLLWKQIGFIRPGGFWLLIRSFGARWPLPWTVPFSARHVSAKRVSGCTADIYIYIFLFILGTLMVKDFLSPCCNAACQFGRLFYAGPRPLPFLSCLNALFWHACQQVWSGVKSQVVQKWRGCHIGWTSRSWNSTFCGTAQDVCTDPAGTRATVTTGSPSRRVVFMSLGKYLCFDPNVAVPLLRWLSDSLALPSPWHEDALSFIPLVFLERFGSQPAEGDLIPVVSITICRQRDIAALLVAARKSSW